MENVRTEIDTYRGVMYVAPEPLVALYPGDLFSLAEVANIVGCKQSEIVQCYGFYQRWTMPGYLDCGEWGAVYADRELTRKSKYWTEPEN